MEAPPSAHVAPSSQEQGVEKIEVKPEPTGNPFHPDETMPDVPAERRLPPKKMKLLEERNGAAAASSPSEEKPDSGALKRSREEESSDRKSSPEPRNFKHSDDEEGPRIRLRASTMKASFDGHFVDDSEDEEERERLQRIFEEDQDAAQEAGMNIEKMTKIEQQELPASAKRQNRYLEIRNHILKLWVANKKEYLSKEAAVRAIQKKYAKEAGEIYAFLTRFGFINVGYLFNRPTMEAKESVIVIGAGMAGIAAAYHLHTLGYRVKVLEGRDRVGGRCNTSWSGSQGMGVDMGAMVVTGKQGNPVAVFAEQLGIKMHRLGADCPIFDWNGKPVPEDIDKAIEKRFNEVLTEAAKFSPEAFTSLGKAIDALVEKQQPNEAERSLFNWHFANLEYGCAAELGLVDLHHWDQDDQYELGGGHYLVPTGYGSIVKGLAKHLDVRLSHAVQKVAYTSDGVDVTCNNDHAFHADYAICTLPLGILKTGKITFDPPLPEDKQASVQKLGFGLLNKLALYFEKPFWSPDTDYFGITSNEQDRRGENFLFWNMQRATGMPVLLALIAGKAAKMIEYEKDEEIVERSLRVLKSVYGDLPHLERYQVTRWASDPFACGSYSYIAEGATGDDYDVLARPLGRLRFAGEATSREHPATVVGACLSGLQAAGELDRTCRGSLQELRGDEEGDDTPAHRRRRISETNVPSFRKRESDTTTPLKDNNTDTPSQRPAALFTLPSTELLAAEESSEMKVDVESIRRTIQAQPPARQPSVPPLPSVAPPAHATTAAPFLSGPLAGTQYASSTGAPHAVVPQPAADVVTSPAAAPSNGAPKKFREELSDLVVNRLRNRYLAQGRIASKEDFKHLARKMTHIIFEKEQKLQRLTEPAFTEDVRKKAKRFMDDFFSKLDVPYHSEKTGPLQLPDPLQKQREERKKAKKMAKDKHKHKHKHHGHGHGHHRERPSASTSSDAASIRQVEMEEAEPEAPPMSPVDDAPVAPLAALPQGFVPMAVTTDQGGQQ